MHCTFAQYLRIETAAGGSFATRRQIIRAAHTLLSEKGRSPEAREVRHAWLREVLDYHADAIDLAIRLGAPNRRS